mmetsp:Transcript_29232/g.77244  ORF Transcript_29232/g.77244 Transcript_29232/m.77244 type:complete len:246 (+) Transcript_29232:1121-1858(+)
MACFTCFSNVSSTISWMVALRPGSLSNRVQARAFLMPKHRTQFRAVTVATGVLSHETSPTMLPAPSSAARTLPTITSHTPETIKKMLLLLPGTPSSASFVPLLIHWQPPSAMSDRNCIFDILSPNRLKSRSSERSATSATVLPPMSLSPGLLAARTLRLPLNVLASSDPATGLRAAVSVGFVGGVPPTTTSRTMHALRPGDASSQHIASRISLLVFVFVRRWSSMKRSIRWVPFRCVCVVFQSAP